MIPVSLDELRKMWDELQDEKAQTPPGEAPLPASSPGVEEPAGGAGLPTLSASRRRPSRNERVQTVRGVLLLAGADGALLDHVARWIVDELEALE